MSSVVMGLPLNLKDLLNPFVQIYDVSVCAYVGFCLGQYGTLLRFPLE